MVNLIFVLFCFVFVFVLREISLRCPLAVRSRAFGFFFELFFDIVHLNGNVGNSSLREEILADLALHFILCRMLTERKPSLQTFWDKLYSCGIEGVLR